MRVIDGLRGLACVAVCLYHVGGFTIFAPNWFSVSTQGGWLGVEVFFVISGFVVPYSLRRGGYVVRDFWQFLAKRLVRLEPPYLVTLAAVIASTWLAAHTPLHRGGPPDLSWQRIALHLGYLIAFTHQAWFLDSFWTLAVEFQFYLSVGLLYPLLVARTRWAPAALLALGGLAWLIPSSGNLPHFLPVFLLGIFAFRYRTLGGNLTELLIAGGVAGAMAWLALGPAIAVVSAATAVVILAVDFSHPVLSWLGGISYSLYLIHPLIIEIVVIQGARVLGTGRVAEAILVSAALAAAFGAAMLLHRWVEVPARRAAGRLSYK